jgi:hypothetical protein
MKFDSKYLLKHRPRGVWFWGCGSGLTLHSLASRLADSIGHLKHCRRGDCSSRTEEEAIVAMEKSLGMIYEMGGVVLVEGTPPAFAMAELASLVDESATHHEWHNAVYERNRNFHVMVDSQHALTIAELADAQAGSEWAERFGFGPNVIAEQLLKASHYFTHVGFKNGQPVIIEAPR